MLKGCRPDELIAAISADPRRWRAHFAVGSPACWLKQFRVAQDASLPATILHEVLLSERETEVLKLVAQGYVNKEIAQRLVISPATVGSHIKNLYRKLAVHSRVQVVRVAQERGLL